MNQESAPSPRLVYGDIIDLPHHQSPTRPHMSLHDRAAQFAPFAALTGYEEMVDEEARLTEREISLGDADLDILDQQFRRLSELLSAGSRPPVTVTFFVPDPHKAGGRYDTVSGLARRLDPVEKRLLLLTDATPPETLSLDMNRILEIDL